MFLVRLINLAKTKRVRNNSTTYQLYWSKQQNKKKHSFVSYRFGTGWKQTILFLHTEFTHRNCASVWLSFQSSNSNLGTVERKKKQIKSVIESLNVISSFRTRSHNGCWVSIFPGIAVAAASCFAYTKFHTNFVDFRKIC